MSFLRTKISVKGFNMCWRYACLLLTFKQTYDGFWIGMSRCGIPLALNFIKTMYSRMVRRAQIFHWLWWAVNFSSRFIDLVPLGCCQRRIRSRLTNAPWKLESSIFFSPTLISLPSFNFFPFFYFLLFSGRARGRQIDEHSSSFLKLENVFVGSFRSSLIGNKKGWVITGRPTMGLPLHLLPSARPARSRLRLRRLMFR